MPLNSSLIRGAKFVWGKTQLQFGKTTVTGVFSEQNHRQKCHKVVQSKILICLLWTMIAIDTFSVSVF
jgi:cell surface protein SprA